MTMFLAPYTAIADIDGSPLDAGFLFFGEYGKDPELFPVEVFWDADFSVPATQPIRTRNGYPVRNGSPTKVYLKTAQHSIVIKNRNSAFILVDFKNKGWDASFVVDGDKNQHQINEDQTALNNKFLKFKQSEAGAVEVDLSVRAKTQQYLTDYTIAQDAFAVKRNNSTYLQIPNGQYNIDGALPLNGSHLIEGQGDQTILKFAGAGNGIVYSSGSKFDDHAHRIIRNIRIQGDNTKSGIVDAKDGTTVGYKVVATGHFGEVEGVTFEGHAVGHLVQQNYTSRESYNYYRSNKVGLHLNGITSYRIESIYARYNSDAAILITGDIQNLTIDGGAIEGNRGRGIWAKDLSVANTRASININDLYMEVDGDYAAGIPAVDIQEVDNMTIAVRSGVFWLNTASGITSGVYKWGQNVSFDGTSLAGYHYAKNMSIINRGVVEVGRFNTCDSEAASRLHGLVEPVLMHKFEPREVRNALIGTPFLRGKPSSAIPFSNTAATAYPYTNAYSGGISVAEDTASDYGDGSFQSLTIPAAGNFNSNYVELTNYDSAVNPYYIFCFMLKPAQDMEIGFTQAGAQTQYTGYFKLKAGVTYKLVMTGNNTAAAINRLRMFSLESTSKTVSFKPIIKATFKNRDDCIGFINRHCLS